MAVAVAAAAAVAAIAWLRLAMGVSGACESVTMGAAMGVMGKMWETVAVAVVATGVMIAMRGRRCDGGGSSGGQCDGGRGDDGGVGLAMTVVVRVLWWRW